MAKIVYMCLKCGRQEGVDPTGYCPDCGPVQVCPVETDDKK